ncbi:Hypothetical protein CM240_1520 [Clostridium bornimense]|uniref:YgjP-like metallopeptidase domain-containing protein n=1 Tax=Clostridium bornimense TaxID=1216932 RepID=W6RYH7_9CLOT|nr:YgjP-like metallopeptidase domain-containing protein [Clostridium bornimense]CDM68679.1 Hypothetical protein CM240_1520 [Clostridium bornimense]
MKIDEYEVKIKKENRKTIKISIEKNFLVVKAPGFIREDQLEKILFQNINKVRRIINKNRNLIDIGEKHFLESNNAMLLGKSYKVEVINSYVNNVEIIDDTIIISVKKDDENLKIKLFKNFYKNKCIEVITPIYKQCLDSFVEDKCSIRPRIEYKFYKGRWGAYYPKDNKIVLNCNLVKLDEEYIRYVIFHEISHTKIPNHSKEFYNVFNNVYDRVEEMRIKIKKYIIN